MDLQNLSFLGIGIGQNSLENYLFVIAVVVALYLIFRIAIYRILKRLEKSAKRTKTDFDDFMVKVAKDVRWPLFVIISLLVLYIFIGINGVFRTTIQYVLVIFVTYEVILIGLEFIDYGAGKIVDRKSVPYLPIFSKLLKILVWLIGGILILSNLGYNVSSLVAGLGIGGIAIALALQNILGDIFSSLSISFDKPFKIGDFIVLGDMMGNVKSVGLKTTRITTLQGEELIVPNQELVNSQIRNYGTMKRRRIVFHLGFTYDTSVTKLKMIPGMIKKIFQKEKEVTLDRVHFQEYGESSLNYEIVYYIESNEYLTYMNKQHAVNLAIKAECEKEKIKMAFPTRTVYMKS